MKLIALTVFTAFAQNATAGIEASRAAAAAALAVAATTLPAGGGQQAPEIEDAAPVNVKEKLKDIKVIGLDGKSVKFQDAMAARGKSAKAVIIYRFKSDSPSFKSFAYSMAYIQKLYAPKGLVVIGIAEEDLQALKKTLAQPSMNKTHSGVAPYPMFADPKGDIRASLPKGPSIFMLKPSGELLRQGGASLVYQVRELSLEEKQKREKEGKKLLLALYAAESNRNKKPRGQSDKLSPELERQFEHYLRDPWVKHDLLRWALEQ